MNSPVSKWFRLRRLPTWRIWMPVLFILVGFICSLGPNVYGWLAVTERIPDARYVVVEGWTPDYVVSAAKHEFDETNAVLLLTTGLPLAQGMFCSQYKDFATLAAATLAEQGMEPERIFSVPASAVQRGRTAAMAIALKQALDVMPIPALDKKLQVVTLGTHGRRSRAIYQRILGSEWQVGVVSVPQRDFPEDNWYKYSGGVLAVIEELVALVVMMMGGE